jgi:hypothetical protein
MKSSDPPNEKARTHLVNLEKPKQFNQAVLDFLKACLGMHQ